MSKKIKDKKYDRELIGSLILSLLLIWGGFYLSYPNFFDLQKKAQQVTAQKTAEQEGINKALAFGQLNLQAKAFAVYDLETGKLIIGKNENQVLPLASITKIMTALVAAENLKPNALVTIKKTTVDSLGGLREGERWSFANLVALTLVSSSNDGATALAEAGSTSTNQTDFVDLMNAKAQSLGLNDLHFINPTGLDEGASATGGRGSALSVAKLISYILKNQPELLAVTSEPVISKKSLDNFNHIVLNTDEIINQVPGLLASKTGYTDLAGGNLVVVANLGLRRPVAIVVLGSTQAGRFTDTQKLVTATLDYYSNSTN